MRSKKFVLDANIWVSYFITRRLDILAKAVINKKLVLLYCPELLNEVFRVLNYPHLNKYLVDIPEAIKRIKLIGLGYELSYPIKSYTVDIKDDYIIALALQTNAGFVTSGDHHILDQKEILEKKHPKLQIITKKQFEKIIV